jgi:hypothetical protein
MDIADAEGWKLAVMSYPLGCPEYDEMQAVASTGLLDELRERGHYLALHEYAYPIDQWFGEAIPGAAPDPRRGPLAFRYRFWEDFCEKMPNVLLTEVNLAKAMVEVTAVKWQEQMRWYLTEAAKDEYVKAVHLFGWGSLGGSWANFDVKQYATQYTELVVEAAASMTAVVKPDPDPEPEPEPLPSLVGVHGEAWASPPVDVDKTIANLKRLGVKWYKLLAEGLSQVNFCKRLIEAGITPVVRFYQARQFPGRNNNVQFTAAYVAVGVKYFEVCNEPNLPVEWIEGADPTWRNLDLLEDAAESWWQDAVTVIKAGGRAAFPAMAPTDRGGVNPQYSGVKWFLAFVDYMEYAHFGEAAQYFENGDLWLAVHVSPYNKPFDQSFMASWGYDDQTLLWYERLQQYIYDAFGVVPVTMSTEGGVFSPEHLRDLGWEPDYDESTWGKRVWDMYAFLEARRRTHPPGLTAMCSWLFEDGRNGEWHGCGWYDANGNPRSPVLEGESDE